MNVACASELGSTLSFHQEGPSQSPDERLSLHAQVFQFCSHLGSWIAFIGPGVSAQHFGGFSSEEKTQPVLKW